MSTVAHPGRPRRVVTRVFSAPAPPLEAPPVDEQPVEGHEVRQRRYPKWLPPFLTGVLVVGGAGAAWWQFGGDKPSSPPAAGADQFPRQNGGGAGGVENDLRSANYPAGYVCDTVPGILGSLGLTQEACSTRTVPGAGNYSRGEWSSVPFGEDGAMDVTVSVRSSLTAGGGNRMQELAGQAAAGPGIDPYQMPDGSTGYWVPGLGRFSFQSGENTVTDITVGGSAGEAPPEAALGVAGVIANQLFDAQFASQTA